MSMNPKRPAAAFLSAAMLLGMFSPPAQALNTGSTAAPHPAAAQSLGDHPIQILPELDHDGSPEAETTPDRIDWLPLVPATPIAPAETIPALKLTPAQKAEQSEAPAEPEEEELPEIQLFARNEVYTSATASNHVHSGDGTYANPYNLFEDAVENTMPGGKIIIKNKAFLNAQDEGGTLPYVIDRPLTITSEHADSPASLQVRAGGIVLGADVKIENVNLNFENRTHDAFFANGHTLTLKNVLRSNGSREVDLFGGQLHSNGTIYGGNQAGTNSKIVIEMDHPHFAPKSSVHLGNIYAGSMNGSFNGSTTVEIKSASYNGNNFIGEVYASGAKEADPGNMLDPKEPAPPKADASAYPMHGSVTLDFDSLPLRGSSKSPMLIDGKTGSNSKTSLSVSVDGPTSNLKLKDISALTIKKGTIQPELTKPLDSVKIEKGAELDLSKGTEKDFITDILSGNGTLTLKKDGSLTVQKSFNDSNLTFQTEDAWNGKSGMVRLGHSYATVPSASTGLFTFHPHQAQTGWIFEKEGAVWKTKKSDSIVEIPPITTLNIQQNNSQQTIFEHPPAQENAPEFPLEIKFESGDNDIETNIENISSLLTCSVKSPSSNEAIEFIYDDDAAAYIAPNMPFGLYISSNGLINSDTPVLIIERLTNNSKTKQSSDSGSFQSIGLGTYEIKIGYPDKNGTMQTAKAYLTSIPNPPKPDPDTGVSNSQVKVVSPHSSTFGDKINISATISKIQPQLFSATAIEKDKAYLYVNGKSVNNASPVTNETVVFSDISVDEKNGFRAGANQISVVYGGSTLDSAKLNGSAGSATIDVKKADATIELTNKDTSITETYTGTDVIYTPEIKVTAGTNKLQVSNPKITVTYLKNGQIISGAPNVPGAYTTEVRVEEGNFYKAATVDGPAITIEKATPTVTATGTIEESNLVLTANVQGIDSGILPTGTVAFSMAKNTVAHTLSPNTAEVRYNTATLTIPKPEEGTYEITATYKPSSESLYTEASSTKITLKIAKDHKPLKGIKLDHQTLSMLTKGKQALNVTYEPADATNREVVWTSLNPEIASVNNSGEITAIKAGTATIQARATAGDHIATCLVTVTDQEIAVKNVTLDRNSLDMAKNQTDQLSVKVEPYNATISSIKWESDKDDIVHVDATTGKITAKAATNGTPAKITATVNGMQTAVATITVEDTVAITKIDLTPSNLTLEKDQSASLTANITPDNASNQELVWESSNNDAVSINGSKTGKTVTITALKKTTTPVTIKVASQADPNKTATATITVTEAATPTPPTPPTVPVTSVSINETGLSLKKGQTGKFTATVLPSEATNPAVTWSSDHSDIASVDPKTGVVTGHKNGQATIKVTSDENNQLTDSRTVTVIDIPVTEVKIIEAPLSLYEGRGAQLVVRVSPSDATDPSVKWESDDTDILKVDQEGYVTAERKGSATITVTSVAHPELKDSRTISVTRSSSGGSSGGSSHKPSKPDNKPKPEATKPNPEPPKPTVPTAPQIPQPVKPEPPKPGTPVIASAPPVNPTLNTSFTDIPTTHWASESIKDVVSRGLFVGTEKGNFSPDESMTRAMVVTVLHRLAGEPMVQSANQFTDVGRSYYTDAVTWASDNHIVSGTSANTFAPNLMVTREELVVMLYRVANPAGGSSADLTRFADSGKVSGWASTPMQWAVQTGILKGSNGALLPQNKLSRAEAASLISRFTEQVLTR